MTPGPEEHVTCLSFALLPTIKNRTDSIPCLGIGKRYGGETAYVGMEEWRLLKVKETVGYLWNCHQSPSVQTY